MNVVRFLAGDARCTMCEIHPESNTLMFFVHRTPHIAHPRMFFVK